MATWRSDWADVGPDWMAQEEALSDNAHYSLMDGGGFWSPSCCRLSSLFCLSEITRMIQVDLDVEYRSNIRELFEEFDNFQEGAVIGIAREMQPVYRYVPRLALGSRTLCGVPEGDDGTAALPSPLTAKVAPGLSRCPPLALASSCSKAKSTARVIRLGGAQQELRWGCRVPGEPGLPAGTEGHLGLAAFTK